MTSPNTPKKTPWIKTQYDLILVQWDDAAGLRNGWMDRLEQPKPQLALSSGFLIVDNGDHIIIAQDTDADGGHNGRTQIPRGMVKKIRILRKKDKDEKSREDAPKLVPDRISPEPGNP